jgi:CheY-like chemotaxis protein
MATPTLLIADDEALLVASLARLARRAGLECITGVAAEDVVSVARTRHPAVIVLDVNQSTDGRDILAELKRDPETRDIPVMVLSGLDDQYIRHQCLALGAEDYVAKPIDPLFIPRIARLAGLSPDVSAYAYEPKPPRRANTPPATSDDDELPKRVPVPIAS